jgi:hypothetical protein
MTSALSMTGGDLIRALRDAMLAVDDAVRARAEARATELAADGVTTRVRKRGEGAYTVEVTGEGLFEREFGSHGAQR